MTPPHPQPHPRPFGEFEQLAQTLIELDVHLDDQPRHRLFGYHNNQPLAVIDLRPFPPGGIHQPLIEAVAALLALGATQLATALPGRAWSTNDPITPVCNDGDLRQRVVMMTTSQTNHDTPTNWLIPYDITTNDGQPTVQWHPPHNDTGPVEGWVPEALQIAAQAGWDPDAQAAAHQLRRCQQLGHHILLAPDGNLLLQDTSHNPGS